MCPNRIPWLEAMTGINVWVVREGVCQVKWFFRNFSAPARIDTICLEILEGNYRTFERSSAICFSIARKVRKNQFNVHPPPNRSYPGDLTGLVRA